MKPLHLTVVVLLACAVPAMADDNAFSPHRMVGADGSPDMEKCAVCHTETLELARPKGETCTLCHSETLHAGSNEHLRASADAVGRAVATAPADSPKLPLTEDGKIYCGTCHLFHDPALSEDKPLASGWVPPTTGIAETVRAGVEAQMRALAERSGNKGPLVEFEKTGTTALRLPVQDGALCLHCHGSYGR